MAAVDHLPWRFEHWKRHPEKLNPQDYHVAVSICETSEGVKFSEKPVRDSIIPPLCAETAGSTPGTKWSLELSLMTVSPYVDFGPSVVPYSLDAIQALRAHWQLPYSYVPSLGGGPDISTAFSPLLNDKHCKEFVHDVAGSKTTIMHNSPMRRTFGVCLVDEDDVARVIRRLQHAQSFGSNPFLLPTILLSTGVHKIRELQNEVFEECSQLEETMGFDSENHEVTFDQTANFTRIPQRLNVLSARIANTQYYCSSCVEALDCLKAQLQTLPSGYRTSVSAELHEQRMYLRACLENLGFITKRDNTLVQSMTRTVRKTHAASVESLCLWLQIQANLQQRDNQLNHRYGADMRLITAITLIFLPRTFVATIFSTTFWDFSPDDGGAKVSYWVYLYFVSTIGLTLVVLVVWRRFSTIERLTMEMAQSARRIPLLRRLIREKKVDEEESRKKGD